MYVRFNKLVMGAIVVAFLIVGGAFFGSRWIYRDLPEDVSNRPTPSTSATDVIVVSDDGGTVSTPSSSDRGSSDAASAESSVLRGKVDRVTADLEKTRVRLNEWCDNLLNQFPDVPAVKATVEGFQELLRRVTARNQQLKEKGVPMEARIKQLANFAEKTSGDIVKRRRTNELHLQLLRENTELKLKIDRYLHHRTFLPLPPYLLGLNEEQLQSLQQLTDN